MEKLQLELQMQQEDKERERQFQLEKMRLELWMKNEAEKEKEKTRVRELELEHQKEKERTKQMEIEANRALAEKRIERGLPEDTTPVSHPPDNRHREKDIPQFVPEEAESFFEHFEKVAQIKHWP